MNAYVSSVNVKWTQIMLNLQLETTNKLYLFSFSSRNHELNPGIPSQNPRATTLVCLWSPSWVLRGQFLSSLRSASVLLKQQVRICFTLPYKEMLHVIECRTSLCFYSFKCYLLKWLSFCLYALHVLWAFFSFSYFCFLILIFLPGENTVVYVSKSVILWYSLNHRQPLYPCACFIDGSVLLSCRIYR